MLAEEEAPHLSKPVRLYISGPMSGLPQHNFPAFAEARESLRAVGYEVVCPAELGKVEKWTWADYLRRDLQALLECEAVALLDGWEASPGANLEVHVARALFMTVEPIRMWLLRDARISK